LTVNGTHVIGVRERGNIPINYFNPETGEGKFSTGVVFSPGKNSILTLKIGGNYMLGRFFPMGEILSRARFSGGKDYPGGKSMLQHRYNDITHYICNIR
jgi:hypothetical protein